MNSNGKKDGKRRRFWRVLYSRIEPSDEVPFLVKLMIKHNIARNQFQSFLLMLLLIIGFTFLSFFFFNKNNNADGFLGESHYKRNINSKIIPVGLSNNLPTTSIGELQASPRGARR